MSFPVEYSVFFRTFLCYTLLMNRIKRFPGESRRFEFGNGGKKC